VTKNTVLGSGMNDPEGTMHEALPNSGLIAHLKALKAAGLVLPLPLTLAFVASSIQHPASSIGREGGGWILDLDIDLDFATSTGWRRLSRRDLNCSCQ